jgi:hypothetical protein
MIVQPDRGKPILLCSNRCLFGFSPRPVILETNSELQAFAPLVARLRVIAIRISRSELEVGLRGLSLSCGLN